MTRAEDGSQFNSLEDAYNSQCKICGEKLDFDENDMRTAQALSKGTVIATAQHCQTNYLITLPSTIFQVQTTPVKEEKAKAAPEPKASAAASRTVGRPRGT